MSENVFGPLQGLIGTWKGDQGHDESPEPDGTERNEYTETISFSPIGDVDNAETQELVSLHYHQVVHRIRDGKEIHNQTGYWIWDSASQTVMHSFAIPRALCVVAGGQYDASQGDDETTVLEVSAGLGNPDWPIAQSPFLRDNASTSKFTQRLTFSADQLHYRQTTLVDIYDYEAFEHTDESVLQRQS